jgi:hypothetical protein
VVGPGLELASLAPGLRSPGSIGRRASLPSFQLEYIIHRIIQLKSRFAAASTLLSVAASACSTCSRVNPIA